MSLSKVDKARQGPGWGEIFLGVVLCILLGVVLASVHLALKPVETITKAPDTKDPKYDPKAITFMEGSKDSRKGATFERKRQAFLAGTSIELTEDELNSAVAAAITAAAAKPKEGDAAAKAKAGEKEKPKESGPVLKPKKKDEPPPAAADEPYLVPGPLNFRIENNLVQAAIPVRIPLMDTTVIIQAAGDFRKGADGVFTFVPQRFHVGCLPVHKIPGACELVVKRAMEDEAIPADMKAQWAKATDVIIEGRVLKVFLP